MSKWYEKWRIKINESQSTHVTCTLRKKTPPPVFINNTQILTNTKTKYLGLVTDKRLI